MAPLRKKANLREGKNARALRREGKGSERTPCEEPGEGRGGAPGSSRGSTAPGGDGGYSLKEPWPPETPYWSRFFLKELPPVGGTPVEQGKELSQRDHNPQPLRHAEEEGSEGEPRGEGGVSSFVLFLPVQIYFNQQ